jgi:hypothetical protein
MNLGSWRDSRRADDEEIRAAAKSRLPGFISKDDGGHFSFQNKMPDGYTYTLALDRDVMEEEVMERRARFGNGRESSTLVIKDEAFFYF